MRKVRWTRKNVKVIPWVILRVIILGPLWLLAALGEKANALGEWLAFKIPGFED